MLDHSLFTRVKNLLACFGVFYLLCWAVPWLSMKTLMAWAVLFTITDLAICITREYRRRSR